MAEMIALEDPENDVGRNVEFGTILGNGAFSTVYKVILKPTGIYCACKIFYDPTTWNSFNVELANFRLYCASGHPNLVKYYGKSIHRCPMLLMEKMDCTLTDYYHSRQSPRMDMDKIRMIIRDTLAGLSHIHRLGGVHRDIHVNNILMLGDQAKIGDIGSIESNNTNWQKDVKAVGYVMAQLITGYLGFDYYPRGDDQHLQRLLHDAHACCSVLVNEETAAGIQPTSLQLLLSMLHTSKRSDQLCDELTNSPGQFHGRIHLTTPWQELDNENILYLDRHFLYCEDFASAMSSFQLMVNHAPNVADNPAGYQKLIQFAYTRLRLPYTYPQDLLTQLHSTPMVPDGSHLSGRTRASLFALVNVKVYCPGWSVLKGFHLTRNNTVDQIRIDYHSIVNLEMMEEAALASQAYSDSSSSSCGSAAAEQPCVKEIATEWNEDGQGQLSFLDRHKVICPMGTVLKGFMLEHDARKRLIRIKYWIQKPSGGVIG